MIKALLIAESASAVSFLEREIRSLTDISVIAALLPDELVGDWQQKYKYDCVIISNAIAAKHYGVRQQIMSKTHQGLQLVDVEDIYYFEAEHKYVTAYYSKGQLLIEDSLNSLEREFAATFLRIHRKILVAKNKVEKLYKDDFGHYLIKLKDIMEPLVVSRRKVAQIRKNLSC